MPAYNFKAQFADKVEGGYKNTTIRPVRKRITKPGDTLYLYTGMRTKQCRKLGEAACLAVKPIRIKSALEIYLDYVMLSPNEILSLSKGDGFLEVTDFIKFFRDIYGLPFYGELIEWVELPEKCNDGNGYVNGCPNTCQLP